MRQGTIATSCALSVMTGFMIYMPLHYQLVHALTPTEAGAAELPSRPATLQGTTHAADTPIGRIFVTVNDLHKAEVVPIVRRFHELGFKILATEGTAKYLR